MAKVEVYSKRWCGYCHRATRLFDRKGVPYDTIDVTRDRDREREMIERSGGRYTVPQIFIDDRHIGGSDELIALESRGELDALLSKSRDENEATLSPDRS